MQRQEYMLFREALDARTHYLLRRVPGDKIVSLFTGCSLHSYYGDEGIWWLNTWALNQRNLGPDVYLLDI